MISKNRLAVAAISAGLVVSMLGMGAAQADPSGPPSPRALTGVGSDTTQAVMNAVASDLIAAGKPDSTSIGSWDAGAPGTSATFNTGKAGCSTVSRPNGSGAGRDALLASLNAGDGCIQFARSSSLDTATHSPSLTYIPYAVDAVSYAVTANSNVPRTGFALSDLQAIYHCDPNYVGTGPNWLIQPVLPQSGSGTRSFWEGQMNITDNQVAGLTCILNGKTASGATIEEHTGTFLTANEMVPFSIGQFTDQSNGLIIDRRGNTVLGTIGTSDPQVINGNFAVKRNVYNVIPTSQVGTAPYTTDFVGTNSLVCQDSATIQHYGFALIPGNGCGDTSQHS